LAASLACVFVHVPLQFVVPLGHAHVPLLHEPPTGHEWPEPHAPQNVVDVSRFVSQPFAPLPSQLPKFVLQVVTPQTPVVQLAVLTFVSEHAAQVAPLAPQLVPDSLAYTSQLVPLLQHPAQPEDVLQMHAPLLQASPVPHPAQVAPPLPQLVVDSLPTARQVVALLQQPVHPDDVLHTQAPLLQASPVPHPAQAAPPLPQLVADSLAVATQVFPLQHPAHPDDVLHTQAPALHVCPVAHATHAMPPVPHEPFAEVWHLPELSQQPLGHEVASQTHAPLPLQRCPCRQAPQVAPPVPQVPAPSLA
jgi:hypothetical protein